MILIYPPVSKPCEPPLGLTLLAGALASQGLACTAVDASVEGLLWLARNGNHPSDLWTRRAMKHREANLADLRTPDLYRNADRYRQRVMDVNRVISTALPERFKLTLSDYTDTDLRPVRSQDLLKAAETFQENPFFGYFEDRLAPRIQTSGSVHVGISLCFLSQALTAFALAGWVRARFPEKRIVMGGGLITSWMSSPDWTHPFEGLIDVLVKGAGEDALVALEGGTPDPKGRYPASVDWCDWDLYLAPGRILPSRTSSGCYWSKCRFCPEKAEGGCYRAENPGGLLHDLVCLSQSSRTEVVHFLDNAIPPSFLRKAAGKETGFSWYGFVRFTRDLEDPEFCRSLYRSGCRMLNLGLESGDQAVLDSMVKGTDLAMASRVLASLSRAGIRTYVYLLFGTAQETEASAEKTLDYVARHSDWISFLNIAIFNLPRFGVDARELATDAFYDGDLSLYSNFSHPRGWDRIQVRRFVEKRFKKHPAIARIVRRDPPYFTSNHALFL